MTAYRVLGGQDVIDLAPEQPIILVAMWRIVGCTCRTLGIVGSWNDDGPHLSAIHDERCRAIGHDTEIIEVEVDRD